MRWDDTTEAEARERDRRAWVAAEAHEAARFARGVLVAAAISTVFWGVLVLCYAIGQGWRP